MITKLLGAWRAVCVACAAAAVCLPVGARLVLGPPGAVVHVRWTDSVVDSARHALEARFRLADGQRLGESTTWRYDLIDPSPDTIRALVHDPAVDDTHGVDRARFVVEGGERTARRSRVPYGGGLIAIVDGLSITLALIAAALPIVAFSRTNWARELWGPVRSSLLRREERLLPFVLLATVGLAVYAVALRFPPTDEDDVAYLASVVMTANPLVYFIQDHGHGNDLYRPLTPVSMWLVYKTFGVWALPNQIINLLLHLANACLLYRIVQRVQWDRTLAWVVAAVFMISQYTYVAATWTADRPMVLTGLFLLLLINHLTQRDTTSGATSVASVSVSSIAVLSVLALMSKESGLVVAATGVVFALMANEGASVSSWHRRRLVIVPAAIIGLYMLFRLLIFGSDSTSYSQDGYMFLGMVHYQDSDQLPSLLRYLNYGENLVKNVVAPLFPIFAEGGALLNSESFLLDSVVIVSTGLLFALALGRNLSRLQWLALIVIVLNAVVHFSLFRLRLQYLSHAALCLFVAGSPILGNRSHPGRTLAVKALALIILSGGILRTSAALNAQMVTRSTALTTPQAEGAEHSQVWGEVLLKYR